MEIPEGWGPKAKLPSVGGMYGYFRELHINPLSPDIHIQILYTQFGVFP